MKTTKIPDKSIPASVEIPEATLPSTANLAAIIQAMDGLCGAAGQAGFSTCPYTFFFNIAGEGVVIVTMEPGVHAALMRDFKTVEKREAEALTPRPTRLMKLSAGPTTTFGTIFGQMVDIPLSAFSVTCPNPQSGEFLFAQFFVRTEFTITELRKEMTWAKFIPLEPGAPSRLPPSGKN